MKNILLFILLITLTATAPMLAQEKKAQAILDEVAKITQSYSSVRIDFDYLMENKAQKINEKYTGVLTSKGDKYRLEIADQLITSDGKTVWTFLEQANEVQINDHKQNDDGFSPTRFLQSWSDDYKTKSLKETGTEQQIELQPKKASNFNKVILVITKQKKQLKSIQLFDGNGNVFSYTVKKFTTNQLVPDKDFTFIISDYPGIEVVDMR
ncbi:MAG: outer membrane lipoprotein carrier protein LolA [Bacteroidales bacterium]|nr:outer membrane lipoprotein carrier protein LolA [Bacteroidales bacterium]MDZ4205238.1 outer membrane lipoprotein carrier protein LolA [Bacteroidales bacterium]